MLTPTKREGARHLRIDLPAARRRTLRCLAPSLTLPLLYATAVFGAPPSVRVWLDPTTATVGDLVTATIEVETAGGAAPGFPAWGERWGEVEVVEARPVTREGAVSRQAVTLRAFRVGRLALPPLAIEIKSDVESSASTTRLTTPNDLALEVRSVLPAPQPGQPGERGLIAPKPPTPPRGGLPAGAAFWWSAGAGVTLCLAAIATLLWRERRRGLMSSPDTAVQALAELEAALVRLEVESPDTLPAHVALSSALRRYLGRRFAFPALESTTSEIQSALASRASLAGGGAQGSAAPPAAAPITRLLRELDQVKFARRAASRDELVGRRDRALTLARAVDPPAQESAA